jgi:hypothetical protein
MRILPALAIATTLTGCAVPPAISIAGLLADGISYAASGRSMTDHGVSMVAEEDCKLFRALEGEAVCRPPTEGMPSLAEVSVVEVNGRRIAVSYDYPGSDPTGPVRNQGDPILVAPSVAIASLDPAAGRGVGVAVPAAGEFVRATPPMVVVPAPGAGTRPQPKPERVLAASVRPVAGKNDRSLAMAEKAMAIKPQVAAAADDGPTVVVVQSHADRGRALQVARSHRTLGAKVAPGRADGRTVYRVVVAVAPDEQPAAAKARLARAGFKDAWLASF